MLEPPAEDLPGLWFDHWHSSNRLFMSVERYKKILSEYVDADGKNSYTNCFLLRIDHYKCSKTVEHEFLVLHFTHWDKPAARAAICVDRSVNITVGHSSGMITPSSTSSENRAEDIIELIGCASSLNIKSCLTTKFKSFKINSSLSFPNESTRPSALHVAVLLFQVNQQAINYHLLSAQCYWFGHTVSKSLQTLFGQGEEEVFEPDTRGHLGPIPVFKPSQDDDVKIICNGFWQAYEEVMKVVEARRLRRLEEREKLVDQVRADKQREIDERDRQIDEQHREIDERDHELDERDRQIAKMQAERLQMQAERLQMQAELDLFKAQSAV
ncbi:hypothetical protein P692DRAFT_20880727 [Suillus brevipes Sb2]|nr:hypothetical protein P692DRAFT_20880727 [Suillus brevipes Sb2]